MLKDSDSGQNIQLKEQFQHLVTQYSFHWKGHESDPEIPDLISEQIYWENDMGQPDSIVPEENSTDPMIWMVSMKNSPKNRSITKSRK